MGAEWSSKLFNMVLGGLPAARKLIPRHIQQRALARLKDFNPFASVASNDDLLRALRLAWIEAALKIDDAVRAAASTHEWRSESEVVLGFSAGVGANLRALRNGAFDRGTHPGSAPMDQHLLELIAYVPSTLIIDRPDVGQAITKEFRGVIAAIVKCSEPDVPDLYEHLAQSGLPIPGTEDRRQFGDLVYVIFAELIKSPTIYPEASGAFALGLTGLGVELGEKCLAQLLGQNEQIDSVIKTLSGISTDGGLTCWLERLDNSWATRWQSLSSQIAAVDVKIDKHAVVLSGISEEMARLVAAVQVGGRVGHKSGQLAYEMVLALAQRLRPDEALDFDSALKELEATVAVALELIDKGTSAFYQDRFIDEVLASVQQSIEAGQLEKGTESFDHALVELEIRETRDREAAQLRKSQLLENAVMHAMLMRDPLRVADLEEKLAAIQHPERPATSAAFKERYWAYYKEGDEGGLRLPLEVSIELARRRLKQETEKVRLAEAYLSLASALAVLGQRDSTLHCLLEAEGLLKAGLQQAKHRSAPSLWASLQNALGNVLQGVGARESSSLRLIQSLQAYQNALLVFTRESSPTEWSMAQNNLGNVLRILGMREGDAVYLEKAAVALQEALSERPREREPQDWAITQNNLGIVLHHLGKQRGSTTHLLQAVEAYQGALEEISYERRPLDWGATQNNLAIVFLTLGGLEADAGWLQKAVNTYEAALLRLTQERVPLIWAEMQNSLGNALSILGARENSVEQLQKAIRCYRNALLESTREKMPLEWAKTQNNLGTTYLSLGEQERSMDSPL